MPDLGKNVKRLSQKGLGLQNLIKPILDNNMPGHESENALQGAVAILDVAAAIKSSKANNIRQWKPTSTPTPVSAYLIRA